ncbi:MAG: NADH-quinone oxidoreductase subunit M, partial [Candidatus Goldbacteria bacterium]|nr:NADH-quinone oxidoreductase subunit M [Candidatus Goldiibacteriota bacterium]
MQILTTMLFIPVITAILILIIKRESLIKFISLISSILLFLITIKLILNNTQNVYEEKYVWLPFININLHLFADNLSIVMLLLTNFLMPIVILSSYSNIKYKIKKYYFWLTILHFSMIGVFISIDALMFYIFWEMILIPMYFIIGIWGGDNRVYASLKFFIYTMSASILFLIGIIVIYFNLKANGNPSFEIIEYSKNTLSGNIRIFVFISFFIAFAVKTPLIPFHTWLPDAHVEAPTGASVILAGILLKMGGYGFLRFLLPTFPDLSYKYSYFISLISTIAIIYAGLMAWLQTDIKKLIAYSSISHMGLVTLGIFSLNHTAINGAILQMINHGISTGALFLAVGIIYERTHTRLIYDYGGIFKVMPFYSTFFIIILLSSIGFPTTNGFVGEILTITGTFKTHKTLALLAIIGIIIGAVYMLILSEKIFFGKINKNNFLQLNDLTLIEWLYVLPIIFIIFFIGLYPDFIISKIDLYT